MPLAVLMLILKRQFSNFETLVLLCQIYDLSLSFVLVLHLAVQDLCQLVTISILLLKFLGILLLQIQSGLVLAFDGIENSLLLCHRNVDLDNVPSQCLGNSGVLGDRVVHLTRLRMPPFQLDLNLIGLLG